MAEEDPILYVGTWQMIRTTRPPAPTGYGPEVTKWHIYKNGKSVITFRTPREGFIHINHTLEENGLRLHIEGGKPYHVAVRWVGRAKFEIVCPDGHQETYRRLTKLGEEPADRSILKNE